MDLETPEPPQILDYGQGAPNPTQYDIFAIVCGVGAAVISFLALLLGAGWTYRALFKEVYRAEREDSARKAACLLAIGLVCAMASWWWISDGIGKRQWPTRSRA